MVLAGALLFAAFAASTAWLQLSLQARGYGLLGLATMVDRHRGVASPRDRSGAVAGHGGDRQRHRVLDGPVVRLLRRPAVAGAPGRATDPEGARRCDRRGAATILVVYLPVAGQLDLAVHAATSDQFGERFRGPSDASLGAHLPHGRRRSPRARLLGPWRRLAALAVASGWPTAVVEPLRDEVRILLARRCRVLRDLPGRANGAARASRRSCRSPSRWRSGVARCPGPADLGRVVHLGGPRPSSSRRRRRRSWSCRPQPTPDTVDPDRGLEGGG